MEKIQEVNDNFEGLSAIIRNDIVLSEKLTFCKLPKSFAG